MSAADKCDNLPMGTWPGDPNAPWNAPEPEEVEVEYLNDSADDDGTVELSDMERLALAQALYKAVAELVDTKSETSLRGRVSAQLVHAWEEGMANGAAPKSFDVDFLGAKVGSFSIVTEPAAPAATKMELVVENTSALLTWAAANGCATVDWAKVKALFNETGEVPEGCRAQAVHVPERAARVKSTRLKIDPQKVFERIPSMTGGEMLALMEGGAA